MVSMKRTTHTALAVDFVQSPFRNTADPFLPPHRQAYAKQVLYVQAAKKGLEGPTGQQHGTHCPGRGNTQKHFCGLLFLHSIFRPFTILACAQIYSTASFHCSPNPFLSKESFLSASPKAGEKMRSLTKLQKTMKPS